MAKQLFIFLFTLSFFVHLSFGKLYDTLITSDDKNFYNNEPNPGSRSHTVTWTDALGHKHLFGGLVYSKNNCNLELAQDVWRYNYNNILGWQRVSPYLGLDPPRATSIVWNYNTSIVYFYSGSSDLNSFNSSTNEFTLPTIADLWVLNTTSLFLRRLSNTALPPSYLQSSSYPGARLNSAHWIDKESGDLFLFGGITISGQYASDLWRFNLQDNSWTFVDNSISPPPSMGHAVVTLGSDVLLFGGRVASLATNMVWKYNKTGWEEQDSLPFKICFARSLYVPSGLEIQLFGGKNENNVVLQYVYSRNISSGIQAHSVGSSPFNARFSFALWNNTIFGGFGYNLQFGAVGLLADQWILENSVWKFVTGVTYPIPPIEMLAQNPSGREGAMAWAHSQGLLWFFGGSGIIPCANLTSGRIRSSMNDMWAYNPYGRNWALQIAATPSFIALSSSSPVPSPRTQGTTWSIATQPGDDKFYLFGGYHVESDKSLCDLWEFNVQNSMWRKISDCVASGPVARSLTTKWVYNNSFYLHGGTTDLGDYPGNMYKLNPSTPPQWTEVESDGPYGLSATWFDGSTLWSFGGENPYGEAFYKYNMENPHWEEILGISPKPEQRNSPITWTDAFGNLFLTGGRSVVSPDLSAVWAYLKSSQRWINTGLTPLPTLYNPSSISTDFIYVFGGATNIDMTAFSSTMLRLDPCAKIMEGTEQLSFCNDTSICVHELPGRFYCKNAADISYQQYYDFERVIQKPPQSTFFLADEYNFTPGKCSQGLNITAASLPYHAWNFMVVDVSFGFWMKFEVDTSSTKESFLLGEITSCLWSLAYFNENLIFRIYGVYGLLSTLEIPLSSASLSDFHHFAIVISGSNLNLYLNSTEYSTEFPTLPLRNGVKFGTPSSTTDCQNFQRPKSFIIDEIRMYSYPLPPKFYWQDSCLGVTNVVIIECSSEPLASNTNYIITRNIVAKMTPCIKIQNGKNIFITASGNGIDAASIGRTTSISISSSDQIEISLVFLSASYVSITNSTNINFHTNFNSEAYVVVTGGSNITLDGNNFIYSIMPLRIENTKNITVANNIVEGGTSSGDTFSILNCEVVAVYNNQFRNTISKSIIRVENSGTDVDSYIQDNLIDAARCSSCIVAMGVRYIKNNMVRSLTSETLGTVVYTIGAKRLTTVDFNDNTANNILPACSSFTFAYFVNSTIVLTKNNIFKDLSQPRGTCRGQSFSYVGIRANNVMSFIVNNTVITGLSGSKFGVLNDTQLPYVAGIEIIATNMQLISTEILNLKGWNANNCTDCAVAGAGDVYGIKKTQLITADLLILQNVTMARFQGGNASFIAQIGKRGVSRNSRGGDAYLIQYPNGARISLQIFRVTTITGGDGIRPQITQANSDTFDCRGGIAQSTFANAVMLDTIGYTTELIQPGKDCQNSGICGNLICPHYCTVSNQTFTCVCYTGYEGPDCIDTNECSIPGICQEGEICVNSPGSYSCRKCPLGYEPDSSNVCVDTNECLVNNGNCDVFVICQNSPGSFFCPDCPSGFIGRGNETCTPLCGDGTCDSTIGENCVTCSRDCGLDTCQVCGDGKCENSETCSTCYEDCKHLCEPKKCSGVPPCSGHGTCNDGTCICFNNYNGPICSVFTTPVNVTTNHTGPGLGVKPNLPSNTTFIIAVKSIQEWDENGNIIQQFNLQGNFTERNSTGNFTRFVLEDRMPNRALLTVTVFYFKIETTVSFANINTTHLPDSLKLTIQVDLWPFKSYKNSLAIILDAANSDKETLECNVEQSQVDSGGSLAWYVLNFQGVAMYGQFTPEAVLDGRIRIINFRLDKSSGIVTTIVPHFWDSLVLDPSYSVLLSENTDSCAAETPENSKKKGVPGLVYIIVFSILGGIALIAISIYFAYPKIKLYFKLKKQHNLNDAIYGQPMSSYSPSSLSPSLSSSPLSSDSVQIERAPDMEVQTVAGRFVVQM